MRALFAALAALALAGCAAFPSYRDREVDMASMAVFDPARYGIPPALSVMLGLTIGTAIGALNGWLVTRTGLPSFIVTLGMLFLLRGATIGITRLITDRTQVGGLRDYTDGDLFVQFFAGDLIIGDFSISASVSLGMS